MRTKIDPAKYVGETFGYWTVIGEAVSTNAKRTSSVICKCECGQSMRIVPLYKLVDGLTKSCRACQGAPLYTFKGQTHTVKRWSEITGIPARTINDRLTKEHWRLDEVFTKGLLEQKEVKSND